MATGRVEKLPDGWVVVRVACESEDLGFYIIETYDQKNQKYYTHESLLITRIKCIELAAFIPLYAIGYMALNTLRIFTKTGYALFKGNPALETLKETVRTVVRAPFYALKMWVGAVAGIVFPLQGRRIIAEGEVALHSQKARKNDFRVIPDQSLLFKDVLFGDETTFYAAYCMQPYGSSSCYKIIDVKELPPSQ